MKIIVNNKQAYHDFEILHTVEAGIVLKGTEIKSLRNGKARIAESFVMITNGEAFIHNMSIPHYTQGNINNHDETRVRKLLLKKSEIKSLQDECKRGNLTIIPTTLYLKESRAKLEIAVARGKKLHDKRQAEKDKTVERDLRRGDY